MYKYFYYLYINSISYLILWLKLQIILLARKAIIYSKIEEIKKKKKNLWKIYLGYNKKNI